MVPPVVVVVSPPAPAQNHARLMMKRMCWGRYRVVAMENIADRRNAIDPVFFVFFLLEKRFEAWVGMGLGGCVCGLIRTEYKFLRRREHVYPERHFNLVLFQRQPAPETLDGGLVFGLFCSVFHLSFFFSFWYGCMFVWNWLIPLFFFFWSFVVWLVGWEICRQCIRCEGKENLGSLFFSVWFAILLRNSES